MVSDSVDPAGTLATGPFLGVGSGVARETEEGRTIFIAYEASWVKEIDCERFRRWVTAHKGFAYIMKPDGRILDHNDCPVSRSQLLSLSPPPFLVAGVQAGQLPYRVRQPVDEGLRYPPHSLASLVISDSYIAGVADQRMGCYCIVTESWVRGLRGDFNDWPPAPQDTFSVDTRPFDQGEKLLEEAAWAIKEHLNNWGPTVDPKTGKQTLKWFPPQPSRRPVTGLKGFLRTMEWQPGWPNQRRVWRERKDFFYAWHPYLKLLDQKKELA